jgi:branched-chain amino acid transport system substrate-binding protein
VALIQRIGAAGFLGARNNLPTRLGAIPGGSGMTRTSGIGRRTVLAATGAVLATPMIWRRALAAEPIKVGMPTTLTGPLGEVGQQQKRGAEFFAKVQNGKGGVIGRPLEFLIEDTAGDPATCVRKAQEMVERDKVSLLMGMTLSSEALAVVPKLAQWNAIFVSSDDGDGRLTAESYVPNFFRANTSAPMDTRTVALWLRTSPLKKFYAIGMDYAWGHNSVGSFENLVKQAKRNFVGKVFSPIGTKDFSSYLLKIRESGAQAVFIVMQGDDNVAFLSQAHEYRLSEKAQLLTSIVDLSSTRAVGDAALGLAGSSRYCFAYDNKTNKEFVAMWQKAHGDALPDTFEGEQWQACQILAAGIAKAGSIAPEKLRPALEAVAIDGIKGKVAMRACDHQAEQQGFMVKVVKKPGEETALPEVLAVYPANEVTPPCREQTYSD